ncbi:peptide deformylase [Staphylococcus simiae]|uniref:peptide deformylase n=1 Tax=Staphylococcus simiae TaxID=308354 RepID=UPI001A972535|nr:peptide deformylase [Staphylococcus simiae]MBO1199285.1 peptide deformylase [Staphylococcus simiae]MBO1201511.1 peptide deformylase [Staphylococcus simiae]MBO1203659.1 peptide deformylase [Staphylococcus simiae]MBO1211249.1 peptide deformylase [Staphylococcus simiae]MBO1229899.1 peptide deformylase [Staphylococcus simiae]
MAIKKLVPSAHPLLTTQAHRVTQFDNSLQQLLQDIEDTMYANDAAGLCAPQIGQPLQVAMIDMEEEGLLQLINPTLISQSAETETDLEGSITIPDTYGRVTRSKLIVLESYDINGNKVELTAHDDVARMILHTIDQLNGIPFIERAEHILTEKELEAYFNND